MYIYIYIYKYISHIDDDDYNKIIVVVEIVAWKGLSYWFKTKGLQCCL